MTGNVLPQLLSDAAERFPKHLAVTDPTGSVTYEELEQQSNRIAHILREAGVVPGDRVGLYLPKSIYALAGLYGIMRAGAAYVPLDSLAPASRVAYITRNCGIRCLVTGQEMAKAWPALLAAETPAKTLVVLNADTDEVDVPEGVVGLGRDVLGAAPEHPPAVSIIDQDLAYILYTSGSTGEPKGVMLSHLNALSFVRWCRRYFTPGPADVFSSHAPLHFDLSILDLYVAAIAGAAVVVVPPETSVFPIQLAAFIKQHRITVWYSVPSVLTMLALRGRMRRGDLPSLRHVIFAGEVFPTKHLRHLMQLLPQAQFTNLYGPTETNVCTYYTVPPLSENQTQPIPIGRAIGNVQVFAVTQDGCRAGVGEVGELYVRGPTVAYGYWDDPERTARGFPINPMGPTPDRVYRTGDLVQENEDGDYLFLGRRDHQIKSRGYRIELGDIEAALYAHPAVEECAVIAVPDELISNRIRAYIVLREGDTTGTELAIFCAGQLPRYMIPESFEIIERLPKTSTGKVDRTSLLSMVAAPA